MVRKALFIVLSFGILQPTLAGESELDKRCFETSLILGASVSSGYFGLGDSAWGAINSNFDLFSNGSRPGPVFRMLRDNGLTDEPRDTMIFTDMIRMGSAVSQYLIATGEWTNTRWSETTINDLRTRFVDTTAIFAIDGFYWDAVIANKSYGTCYQAVDTIRKMTSDAAQKGQLLVLGNVPLEDEKRVRKYFDVMWEPPHPQCVTMINSTLEDHCHEENLCYIYDLHEVVRRLNSDDPNDWIEFNGEIYRQPILRPKKAALQNNTGMVVNDVARMATDWANPWNPNRLRGDGVHLTRKGELFISHGVHDLLLDNPPTCE